MRTHRSALLPILLLTAPALVTACAGDASDEPHGQTSSAVVCSVNLPPGTPCTGGNGWTPWAPDAALVNRLQILGQLPATEQKIANLAYFKAAGPAAPSLSVGLVLRDGAFYTQGFGNVAGAEPTADTAYYLASFTKEFTAAGMLTYMEQHPNVKLDDPASLYYPPIATVQYPAGTPAACPLPCTAPPITIRQLLTHASGLPNYGTTFPPNANKQQPSRADFDAMVSSTQLEFYPGYNRDYSGVGLSVIGRILENLTGERYDQFMSSQFLTPLGMTHSAFTTGNLPAGTVLAPSFFDTSSPPGSGQNVTYTPISLGDQSTMHALVPVGHLISTAADVSRFLLMELSSEGGTAGQYPVTTSDLWMSQHELIPGGIPVPGPNDPCTTCAGLFMTNPVSQYIAAQEAGAGWWYGNQGYEGGPRSDATLGNWIAGSGSSGGYSSEAHVAPDVGVASLALSTSSPDGDKNPHGGYEWLSADALVRDAATVVTQPSSNPWTSQPLPVALEGLMALINNGSITNAKVAQAFSHTYVAQHPPLTATMQSLRVQEGSCTSFTVQRINSRVSANLTLLCQNGAVPITLTATSAAPYLVTNFTMPNGPVPGAGAPGVPNGHASVAITGGAGWGSIPVATSNGDGTFRATNAGETSGDTWFPKDATASGATPLSGDFDGDGLGDVALTGGAGWNTIPVAFANADGTFRGTNGPVTSGTTAFPAIAAQSGGTKMVSGDFDGDGYGDIALTGNQSWNTIPVAFSNGDGTFRATNGGVTSGDIWFIFYSKQSGVSPVFGDFDGDGRGDIALVGGAGWTSIPIAFSNGDGTFHAVVASITGYIGFMSTAALAGAKPVGGDFDGDGRSDIALTGGAGWNMIPVAFSRPDGSFAATSDTETSGLDTGFPVYATQGSKPVSGDFDGDGRSDLALTAGPGWNTIPIAFSNGDGSFHGTNGRVTSGYTNFTKSAAAGGVKPAGL